MVGNPRLVAAKARRAQDIGEGCQDILPRAGDDLLAYLGKAGSRLRIEPWVRSTDVGEGDERLGGTNRLGCLGRRVGMDGGHAGHQRY